jgi:hypothetical protein
MKYLRLILVMLFLSAGARAQTLSIPDLTNLANLNNPEAGNYLVQGKAFKLLYSQMVDGLNIQHYESTKAKGEIVIIGNGIKVSNGKLLHTVKYLSTKSTYVLGLIAQASGTGLTMDFHGADIGRNIYLFNNFLYSVNIYINNDNSAGNIDVQQKDYLDY